MPNRRPRRRARPGWADELEIGPRPGFQSGGEPDRTENPSPSLGVEAIDAIIQSFWDEDRASDSRGLIPTSSDCQIVRTSAAPYPARGMAPPAVASAGSNQSASRGFRPNRCGPASSRLAGLA